MNLQALQALATPRRLLYGAVAVAVLYGGLGVTSCVTRARASRKVEAASAVHVQAVAQASAAAAQDPRITELEGRLKAERGTSAGLHAESERLHAEVARLKAEAQGQDHPDLQPVVTALEAETGALRLEVQGLQQELVTRDDLLKVRTEAAESWKAAYQQSAKEAALLRCAHEAQVAALKAEQWKGRIEGLAVGIGVGYVAGRIR